jgi:hypothetical protein
MVINLDKMEDEVDDKKEYESGNKQILNKIENP